MIRVLFLAALAPVLAAQTATAPEPAPADPAAPVEQVLRPPEPGRFKTLFQPFRTDNAAISPDGKYLAYSVREQDVVSVLVIDLAQPDKMKARVKVVDDEAATPMLKIEQAEKTPGQIISMRWTTPSRLLVETNQTHSRLVGSHWVDWRNTVVAFDADGGNARRLVGPDDVAETIMIDTGTDGKNRFSVKRDNRMRFSRNLWTADQPVMTAGEEPYDPFLGTELPPEPDIDTTTLASTATLPRNLRVFDFDSGRPGAVTVIAAGLAREAGNRQFNFYSLDSIGGKLTELANDLVLSTNDPLLDRQGHIRLTLPNSLLSGFPLRYSYLGAKGQGRRQMLDEAAGFAGFSVSPENYFGARAIPLGFDANPDILYYASNVGRDTFGIYSVNLVTKQRGALTMENPAYDLIGPPTAGFPERDTLVFDRYQHRLIGVRYYNALRTTAWLRPEWQAMQAELERLFPGRSVEITDWDEAGRHFVLNTEGPADPGAFYVYDRETKKLLEFVRRAPWVDANHTHLTLPFSYATPDGARISGLVTVPQQPRLKPIPMVVLCPDFPWQRVRSDFQSDVQALADMGFVIVQLNGRGAWGLGLKQRQSLTAGYDLVQVEDIATTVASLEKVFQVNPRRVALMGRGHGGFIALRALQTHPDKFRCAIALESQVDLADWFAQQKWSANAIQPQLTRGWLGDETRLKAAPLTSHPEKLKQPVLMLNYGGPTGDRRPPGYVQARQFAAKLRSQGTEVQFGDLNTDYMNGLPAARAAVFDQIEDFLNTHVYDFKVRLHDLEIIKQSPSSP